MKHSPALVLFDIDGTLVRRAGPTHRDALVAAIWEVLRIRTRNDNIAVHGKLDPDILMEMMGNAGIPRARANAALHAIYRAAERHYFFNVRDISRKACPGTRRLLRLLHRRGAMLGLVTGNLARIAWKKLEMAGLSDYFLFGAFGEMAYTRTELARIAMRHASKRGWSNGSGKGVLVGDTPNDVEAGRANGLHTIAVATGLCSLEELQASSPTLCAPDLSDPAVADWFSEVLLKSD